MGRRIFIISRINQEAVGKEVRTDTKRKTDSRGMTLVEMVVTFAVAAIFMAAAAALVLPATKMTLRIKGMNRVHDDAAIIMETIVNELSYADGYIGEDGSAQVPAITLKEPFARETGDSYHGYYQKAEYSDKGGNPAIIRTGTEGDGESKDRLQIIYAAIGSAEDEEGIVREEIKWEYGKGLYRDNRIRLGFQKKADAAGNKEKNIITIQLTVTDPVSGYSYTQKSDVRCMNVTADRIKED